MTDIYHSDRNQQTSPLPKGWAYGKLEYLIYIAGRIGWRGLKADEYQPDGPLFLSVYHLNKGDKVDFSDSYHISKARYDESPEIQLQENDILLVKDGAGIGKLGIVKSLTTPATVNSSLLVIRSGKAFIPKFLFYFLKGPSMQGIAKDRIKGSATPHLFQRDIKQFELLIPPLAEQHRIVAKIEELFSDLDAGVASLRKIQAQLKRYRQAVLKAAVEGKLTAEWRKANADKVEQAAVLLEKIRAERQQKWKWGKYKEPRNVNSSDLPLLPEGWLWVRAEQICDFITKGTTPAATNMKQGSGEIPFIKIYNLTKTGSLDFRNNPTFVSKATHEGQLARSKVYPGDVLMNLVGPPLGKVSIVPDTYPQWNLNQAIAIFRLMSGYEKKLLAYALLTDQILSWALKRSKATAGQHNLTLEISRDLPLPLPPLAEQQQIVAEVERRLSVADAVEKTVNTSLKQAERLRQSILKRAFEGKLVPQDASDEPAQVLLERIRENRVGAIHESPQRSPQRESPKRESPKQSPKRPTQGVRQRTSRQHKR